MKEIERLLSEGGIDSARFEAREIVNATADREKRLEMVRRRLDGEPLQYILGEWEFYLLPFITTPAVLIPRADTETLCDMAIEFIGKTGLSVMDLCSGSGAVAVAVAKNCPNARVSALEKSPEAFEVLKQNIKRSGVSVAAVLGDLTTDVFGKYDLILSNPPYIKTADLALLQREVRHEPQMALDGGEDGLFFYREILNKWLPTLNAGGMLAVEIGFDQAAEVKDLFIKAGLSEVGSKRDLSGVERVIFGTLKGL